MTDVPNNATSSECLHASREMMLRLESSVAHVPTSIPWRWMLFDRDLHSGVRFSTGCAGPVVTFGLPWLSAECSLRWLGTRCFFWPQGIPARRRISIISSRLKQRLDEESWWFDLLRTAILRTDATTEVICTVTGTASHRFACRAAELFGRSLLNFHVDEKSQPVDELAVSKWLIDTAQEMAWDLSAVVSKEDLVAEPTVVESYVQGTHWSVFVSPQVMLDATILVSSESANAIDDRPFGDRLLFVTADRLQVLRMRTNGTIQALLQHHAHDAERCHALVVLASDAEGLFPAITPDSTHCIIPWMLTSGEHETDIADAAPVSSQNKERRLDSEIPHDVTSPLTHPDDWLLHWTRSTVGPWPDQDEQEFDDELILGCRSSDRSALATLLRIVNEGTLWSSSEAIRGGFRVVSFTEVPLNVFRQRRTYRRHRRRYDFEPWGIAIRRDILASADAHPVTYGDDELWRSLSDDKRPFFQNIGTGDGWTADEREWRIASHVQLNELPASAVIVFVDTTEAMQIVQKQTKWQVIAVPDNETCPTAFTC